MIRAQDVSYRTRAGRAIVDGVTVELEPGRLVGLVGANGSGKTTLIRLLNGLLPPSGGQVEVDGLFTHRPEDLRRLRLLVGLVFQNPDSQMVTNLVEDEVAFGPENLNLPREEILARVDWALEAVGLQSQRKFPPQFLSGGQKQRLAIASALALKSRYLILDEPTSMLDPAARQEFLAFLRELRRSSGLGVLMVTHHLQELEGFDEIWAMRQGQLTARFPCSALPDHRAELESLGVDWPEALTADQLLPPRPPGPPQIVVHDLSCSYGQGTPFAKPALRHVEQTFTAGARCAIVGPTGSGKSTLAQHLNGLMRPQKGSVTVEGRAVPRKGGDVGWLRQRVGYLFQSPESQFFEESVRAEVAFGPHNFGLKGAELEERVREALDVVGLPLADFGARNPFELSGGERRRVALASVLSCRPQVLVLDEPTAGLDGPSRRHVLDSLGQWQTGERSVLLISHHLEEMARLVDEYVMLRDGQVVQRGPLGGLL